MDSDFSDDDVEAFSDTNIDASIEIEYNINDLDNKEIEDLDDIEEESDNEILEDNETKQNNIEIKNKEVLNKIKEIKKKHFNKFSSLGMINLLSECVIFIKKGNMLLDGRNDFDYPNETEESYSIESILLNNFPFIVSFNNKKLNIDLETKILLLKKVLRPVDTNSKIFFTNHLKNTFPNIYKNLFNNYIKEEEINEIINNKFYNKNI